MNHFSPGPHQEGEPPKLPPPDDSFLPTGSVVQLISGGLPMTVFDHGTHTKADKTIVRGYHCDWMGIEGQLNRAVFLREQLIHLPQVEAMARFTELKSKRDAELQDAATATSPVVPHRPSA